MKLVCKLLNIFRGFLYEGHLLSQSADLRNNIALCPKKMFVCNTILRKSSALRRFHRKKAIVYVTLYIMKRTSYGKRFYGEEDNDRFLNQLCDHSRNCQRWCCGHTNKHKLL